MPSPTRTVAVPLRPPAVSLAWASGKNPADILDFSVDATRFLADAGLQLISVIVTPDPSLTASNQVTIRDVGGKLTGLTVTLTGGIAGTTPAVTFLLALSSGDQVAVPVLLSIIGNPTVIPPVISPPATGEVEFIQTSPSAIWRIVHNLSRHPSVRIVTTAGDLVVGDVNYPDALSVVLTFSAGFAGIAYLN